MDVRKILDQHGIGYSWHSRVGEGADVVAGRYAFEVKRVNAHPPLPLKPWVEQAVENAEKLDKIPAVVWRGNNRPWMVGFPGEVTLVCLFEEWVEHGMGEPALMPVFG